jgi:cytochrome c oxidase assembly protein subunit 11
MAPSDPHATDKARRAARRTAYLCAGLIAGMAGLSYAAVPLYDLFCKATGFGGTPRIATTGAASVGERSVTVRFDANVAPGLNWRFQPEVTSVEARLGETMTIFYRLTNTGDKPTTGIASFNVLPEMSGAYFNKIQCFCFNEMTLQPGESLEAPVVFFIDPAIEAERDLKSASTITLSYTFFPAKGSPKPVAAAKDGSGSKL